jgi:EAL domain-containing protein (putative c-di-GMP-specific phosphodiesterase class I)
LEVYYQPVIDAQKNTIAGFEALLRWRHPTMGFISPERFIPIAEHSGQINSIGNWVLEQACSQTHDWNLQFCSENPLTIAVNLSGVQLNEKTIHKTLEEIIERTRFDKSLLHLEVTETALIDNTELASIALMNIRKMGIHVSIDDFGKGYCSLTYLQEFEFDTLKIDKDFVQDMSPDGKGLQLVRTLLLLARDLKMDVVAEGVETEEQYNRLKAMRSSYMQGYYFSRPLPASQIQDVLSKGCHINVNLLFQENEFLNPKRTKQ